MEIEIGPHRIWVDPCGHGRRWKLQRPPEVFPGNSYPTCHWDSHRETPISHTPCLRTRSTNSSGVPWELQFDEQAAIRSVESSHRAPVFTGNSLRDG